MYYVMNDSQRFVQDFWKVEYALFKPKGCTNLKGVILGQKKVPPQE